jgi:hypothetical protein
MSPIPALCNRCLTVIGHGHLAADGDVVGGWVEQWAHECAEWCRSEKCQWRHWRSGSVPTHKRGADCPTEVSG